LISAPHQQHQPSPALTNTMATSSQSPAGGAALQGSQQWVSVVVHDRYAVLSMCKEPVNSMDLAMWTQLEKALDELEADKNVQVGLAALGL
jgi:nitroimidazol reductase NimA-like FMN-containing flavoprotein (pyridoxamine 5'-phosphate oxidase superfamily)